jgi:hypothetical protein
MALASLVAISGPFRAQKSLDFQGPPLPIALEMDFSASKLFATDINRCLAFNWYIDKS